jgi:3-oxoacyl-[acyl-carrier-protein] synthase-3
VFKFAVRALGTSIKEVLKQSGKDISEIDLLIPHQANIRIIDHVIKKMGIPKEKVFINLQKYGNTSAASVPIALDEAFAAGRIKSGDLVVLSGFGAGLTYGANLIRW